MKTVVIESPWAGDEETHHLYLQECILDCLNRGESPYASHQMLTDALDESIQEQRAQGIAAGLEFRRVVDLRVFYTKHGWSRGMLAAKELYDKEALIYEVRQ